MPTSKWAAPPSKGIHRLFRSQKIVEPSRQFRSHFVITYTLCYFTSLVSPLWLKVWASYLVLGSITNQSLRVRECHVAWSGSVALVIGNDFHFTMLEHSNARVRRSKINADCWSLCHFLVVQTQSTIHVHHCSFGLTCDIPPLN